MVDGEEEEEEEEEEEGGEIFAFRKKNAFFFIPIKQLDRFSHRLKKDFVLVMRTTINNKAKFVSLINNKKQN